MKATLFSVLILALVFMTVGLAIAQPPTPVITTELKPLPAFGTKLGISDPGATWQNSQRSFSAAIPLYQFDSLDVYFMFPDSANVSVKFQYGWNADFTAPLDSSSSTLMGTDSLVAGSGGRFKAYRAAGVLTQNPPPYGRLVYDFKATKNHAPAYDATTKFKAWYKPYLRVK